ncbi:YraN family protein [Picosynechococcus sp. PCC 11901]|uniref:YraN family protein n=1 Tax=Picosynechococcus sp. PCC 11901 TaxID=2579791 RepID=UPI0010FC3847|nr:YraN family protein [Picosynechococcus sp. PCC 11901]QCS48166.1 YraN family protein [Picosynechococcus sp. PCC 11901]
MADTPSPEKLAALAVGEQGELFVEQHLESQGWQIVASRWRCRWGELDLVAFHAQTKILAFVEVKTRQQRSLDHQGLLAITPSKQRKTVRAAMQFLSKFPQYETYGCRFDVALVTHSKTATFPQGFRLATYLEGAFEADAS